ncbi:MAG TPA: hypothetical protein PLD10_20800, partial [Rhodopila sp.]|nr:hypothetical protein [Rhodopila sp.]
MTPDILITASLAFITLIATSSYWLLRSLRRQERLAARVLMIQGIPPTSKKAPNTADFRQAAVRLMAVVGQAVLHSGVLPAKTLAELEVTLASAGLRGSQGIGVFIGAKILAFVGLLVLTLLTRDNLPLPATAKDLLPLLAAVVGLVLPDRVISGMRKRYVRRLESGIPDILDMMIVCTQAG